MSQLPSWFGRTSFGQKVLAERQAAEASERARLVAKLSDIEGQKETEYPRLRDAIAKAEKDYLKVEGLLAEKTAALQKARGKLSARSVELDRQQNLIECELRSLGFDPAKLELATA